ncbi:hypothetical protein Scep_013986 [Stephania cephalantha]|uniref:Glycosyltransferase family 92 protein n=1 Tax=Stephania cephalantha TaxID=152367 RepID=A0AAP0P186_9MAGN
MEEAQMKASRESTASEERRGSDRHGRDISRSAQLTMAASPTSSPPLSLCLCNGGHLRLHETHHDLHPTRLRIAPPPTPDGPPLTLALFAFALQWRGGLNDPTTRWSPHSHESFPGMATSSPPTTTSAHAASSHSDCADLLAQSSRPSFPYLRDWNFNFQSDLRPKICITTSTSAGLEQILPWLFYHKVIGVTTFYLFVEGKAASPLVSAVLESIPPDMERDLAVKLFYKPCNYELFVKQSLNMEMAIVMAREAGMDWIIHLDTDELMHPAGAREYSLRQLLSDVPRNVDMVIFPNYESSVERDDIKEPFSEVSMFKKNYDHLPKDSYFGMYKEATRGNPNYFLTYGNGKSAARIQDHLRPNGAHRWHNYMKTPNNTVVLFDSEIKLEEAAVLHYTYPKFSDLTSRRDRCGCKPTKEDVKRCFMLEFDRAVIVQGLKESGVYSSTIASAKTTMSKDKFLSSVESSNLSRPTTGSETLSARKMGRSVESQATARLMLEITDAFHAEAIPPESPPSKDNLHLEV